MTKTLSSQHTALAPDSSADHTRAPRGCFVTVFLAMTKTLSSQTWRWCPIVSAMTNARHGVAPSHHSSE
jgi:hypothetical protein